MTTSDNFLDLTSVENGTGTEPQAGDTQNADPSGEQNGQEVEGTEDSQEELLPKSEVQKARNEAKNLRTRAKEAEAKVKSLEDRLTALESGEKTESEKAAAAQQRIAELEGQIATAEQARIRAEVARQFNVPNELVDRIKGDDEDEMREDAEALMRIVTASSGPQRTPNPAFGQGGGGNASSEDVLASLFGIR